jgi:hypothetical protein
VVLRSAHALHGGDDDGVDRSHGSGNSTHDGCLDPLVMR